MKIQGFLKDISGFFRLIKNRKNAIKNADETKISDDEISKIARMIHPGKVNATVKEIVNETNDSKRITFVLETPPYFKAGNYLTIELKIGEVTTSRAYSIITTPKEAYKTKEVSIIVKDYKNGFVSKYLNHELNVNDKVILEIGLGQFNYEKYRDKQSLVFIAGGAGITPFISMAYDILERELDNQITIIYGSDNPNQIIAKKELDELKSKGINVVHVISGKYDFDGEKGFITREIIERYAPINSSYFISGPRALYDHVLPILSDMGINLLKVRAESFPISDISKHPDYPKEFINKEFNIEVHQGLDVKTIKTLSNESIATSLERNGYIIHTACRGGSCGVCRIKVISGDYFIPKENDKRRYTDKEYNYVHSCSTYPLSDMKIKINII